MVIFHCYVSSPEGTPKAYIDNAESIGILLVNPHFFPMKMALLEGPFVGVQRLGRYIDPVTAEA